MRAVRCLLLAGAAAVLMVPLRMHAQAQAPQQRPPGIDPNTMGAGTDPTNTHLGYPGMEDNPIALSMRIRRESLLKQQRKDRMVASAKRLLELTTQLQAEIAAHPELTADDAKKLDDIAKLAHDVKSRMVE
jgi:hypothetical protein